MDNVYAYRLAKACRAAEPGGDYIDLGWSLLKALHEQGFDVTPRKEAVINPVFHEGRTLNEMAGLLLK